MTCFVGATGLSEVDDAIQETSNIIVLDLSNRITLDVNDTSNYVYSTSNILVERMIAEDIYSSNYTDLQLKYGSNYTLRLDNHNSNYVKITSNILVQRIKQLEGSEGEVGDPDADPPIPPIPPTGNYYILATLGTLTAGAAASAIVLADLSDDVNDLEDKVDLNALDGSNYVLSTSNILVPRIMTEVGHGSNYLLRMDMNVSNYVLSTSNILVPRIMTEVGHGSNYLLRMDMNVSNYVLSTSNILVPRIMTEVGFGSNYTERLIAGIGTSTNYWTEQNTNNIYLNKTGNVGIGTNIPQTKLHIYQDTINDTKLIIQNNFTSASPPADIVVSGLTSTTIGNEKILSFPYTGTAATKTYSFTTTEELVCDILIIGGGGSGGFNHGGGGGAGALIYSTNVPFTNSTTYTITIGQGGASKTSFGAGNKGNNSSITGGTFGTTYTAEGGGFGGGNEVPQGGSGGSGGGEGGNPDGLQSSGTTVAIANNSLYGFNGGTSRTTTTGSTNWLGGGGGGAGSVGQNSTNAKAGDGGSGRTISITGSAVIYAGGGGGSALNAGGTNGSGGSGGGGAAARNGVAGTDGLGGGGGAGGQAGLFPPLSSGKGGAGIVIIRYRLPASTSSTLELVRGTTTDGSVDYSVGNYDGDFKVKSVNAGTPTDRMIINSSGNVGIGTTSHATYKLDVNGDINISAGSQFRIGGSVLSTFTPTSANTIGIFNSTQFENVSSLIQIKSSWKPTTAGTADTANGLSSGTSISITGITTSGLITANAGLTVSGVGQSLISEGTITANIINASGLITANGGISAPVGTTTTIRGTLLTNTILASELITANGGITIASGQTLTSGVINTSGLITATQTTAGTNDMLNMRYNSTNGIRFTQRYIGADDVAYDLIQKVANVDKTASLTLYNGNVGIGITNPTRILQVGTGRLAIANSSSDFSQIGTNEGGAPYNTRIVVCGYNNLLGAPYNNYGSIVYVATNTGCHIFLTQTAPSGGETERMRIGNNGNVGMGTTDTSTYKLNVAGDVNCSGVFRVGGVAITSGSKWTTATDPTKIYYNSGNVGIGITNPINKLDVNHDMRISASGAVLFFGDDNSTHIYRHNTSQEIRFVTGNVDNRMIISPNGNVAVATLQVVEKLNVGGSVSLGTYDTHSGSRFVGHFNTTGGNDCLTGMEIESTTLGGNYSQKLHLRSHYYAVSHGRRLTINENGNIQTSHFLGIQASPTYALDIPANGTGSTYGSLGLRYFNYETNIQASITSLSNVSARIGGSLWVGSWIASSSDTRIKEDIQDINDDSALQMILAIEPKTYKYIDKVAKGDKKVYGFIAQQIKEVLPDAIGIEPNYIPNIMLLADYDNEIITLPSQPTKVIIKLNDKIRCYDKDNQLIDVEVIEIIDELTFKIKHDPNRNNNIDLRPQSGVVPDEPTTTNSSMYNHNKIFVSGTEVNDFHTISKEYIFTLNVCATQELHRRIEAQNVIIKELQEKVERLLNNISL